MGKKPRLPRGKMPPGTRVHKDQKKERNKTRCRRPTDEDATG